MNRLVLPLLVGALGGGVFASSCGPTRPPCSTTTCLGCCDSAGDCRSGFDNSACGTRGNLCAPCGLGQSCISGACTQGNVNGMGGGSSGGGSAGGGSSGGGIAGGAAGGSVAGGGSAGGSVIRCDASNCGGCCDAQGQCVTGRASAACGSNGAACLSCASGLVCNAFGSGGRCESGNSGGGSAGGGTAGGAGGGSSGSCSPQTCPSGCCTAQGNCQNPPTTARCGSGGAACVACPNRQSCLSGTCQPCNGCIDIATGRCEPGTQTALCGRSGDFCTNCGVSSTFCSNQQCASTPPSCTAVTCASGCCNPATGGCVPASQQTAQTCGQGSPAALCVACGAQERCDTTATAGACVPTSAPDSGFPPFDGGFPFPGGDGGFAFCLVGFECAVGECCYPLAGLGGVCARIGNPNLLGGTTCGRSQLACSTMTCQPGQVCNAQVGVCQ